MNTMFTFLFSTCNRKNSFTKRTMEWNWWDVWSTEQTEANFTWLLVTLNESRIILRKASSTFASASRSSSSSSRRSSPCSRMRQSYGWMHKLMNAWCITQRDNQIVDNQIRNAIISHARDGYRRRNGLDAHRTQRWLLVASGSAIRRLTSIILVSAISIIIWIEIWMQKSCVQPGRT